MSTTDHVRPDSCPGVLRLHDAADGALARVRVPGGRITPSALRGLADLSTTYADGALELTSRGNVQLRAVARGAEHEVAAGLASAGLLPSSSHERIRNIVASPLAGWDDEGHGDLDDLVRDLDAAILNAPDIAGLSGRFLFGLDDGRGDVSASVDLGWHAEGPEAGVLVVGGQSSGIAVPRARARQVLLVGARAFLTVGHGWRVHHAPDTAARLIEAVRAALPDLSWSPPRALASRGPARAGVIVGPTASGVSTVLVAGIPLGRLTAAQATTLAELADHAAEPGTAGLRFTPWRSVVLPVTDPDAASRALVEAGGFTAADSAWNGVTACAGQPHCVKANADVRALAARMVAAADPTPPTPRYPVHWSGCGRRCGRPTYPHLDVLSLTDDSVLVDEGTVPVPLIASPAEYVAQLRETSPSPTRSMERDRLHP